MGGGPCRLAARNILLGMATGEDDGLTADTVAGSVAARRALGPDAEDAVIEAFLERTGEAIDQRVEQRLAHLPASSTPTPARPDRTSFALAIFSLGVGVPLTGIATAFDGVDSLIAVLIVWVGIALINIVYNRRLR